MKKKINPLSMNEVKGVYGDEEKYSNDRVEKMLYFVKSFETPPKNVLDIGCGTGYFLNLLTQEIEKLNAIGIDISKTAIKIGKKKYPKVKFILADAEKKLPFKNNYFDVVISGENIEHVRDIDTYLAEINRITKKEGMLIVTTPNLASWMNRILLLLGKQPFYLEASLVKTFPIFRIGKYTFPETLNNPPAGHLRLFTLDMIRKLLFYYGYKTTHQKGRWILSKPLLKQIDKFFSIFPNLSFGYVLSAIKVKDSN